MVEVEVMVKIERYRFHLHIAHSFASDLSGHILKKHMLSKTLTENVLCIRVSHLQFFLISLLFQAGIYARHTKEQA